MQGLYKKQRNRSRITSGRSLLPHGVDMRGVWERRWTDVNALLLSDLGGRDVCSTAEMALIRKAATLIVATERLEERFAEQSDGGTSNQLEAYQRLCNTLRRLLESIGLKRRPRNVTPDLQDYLASRSGRSTARVTLEHQDG